MFRKNGALPAATVTEAVYEIKSSGPLVNSKTRCRKSEFGSSRIGRTANCAVAGHAGFSSQLSDRAGELCVCVAHLAERTSPVRSACVAVLSCRRLLETRQRPRDSSVARHGVRDKENHAGQCPSSASSRVRQGGTPERSPGWPGRSVRNRRPKPRRRRRPSPSDRRRPRAASRSVRQRANPNDQSLVSQVLVDLG
jgi:hypothetical protein